MCFRLGIVGTTSRYSVMNCEVILGDSLSCEPGNEEQMLVMCALGWYCCRHEYLMSSKEENHVKEETWTFRLQGDQI